MKTTIQINKLDAHTVIFYGYVINDIGQILYEYTLDHHSREYKYYHACADMFSLLYNRYQNRDDRKFVLK